MTLITIFDLDGVLVDNVAYERAVTDDIVRTISVSQSITIEEALAKWNDTLASNARSPRWHDYSYHCAALGVPDAWRASHLAMRHLIRPMPKATEAIEVGHRVGKCWLASDATSWVVEFKLRVAGIGMQQFDEVFTLDRCGVSKGYGLFWKYLVERIDDCNTATIVIDNRLDRLVSAVNVLPRCQLIFITSEDHPSSLRLFTQPSLSGVHLHQATQDELPDTLTKVAMELVATF